MQRRENCFSIDFSATLSGELEALILTCSHGDDARKVNNNFSQYGFQAGPACYNSSKQSIKLMLHVTWDFNRSIEIENGTVEALSNRAEARVKDSLAICVWIEHDFTLFHFISLPSAKRKLNEMHTIERLVFGFHRAIAIAVVVSQNYFLLLLSLRWIRWFEAPASSCEDTKSLQRDTKMFSPNAVIVHNFHLQFSRLSDFGGKCHKQLLFFVPSLLRSLIEIAKWPDARYKKLIVGAETSDVTSCQSPPCDRLTIHVEKPIDEPWKDTLTL